MTYGLKKCNNWIKSILINRFTRRRPGVTNFDTRDRDARPNGRVLDMGCGKGGDIEKWNRLKIDEYVGIGKPTGHWSPSSSKRNLNTPLYATDVASGSIQDFDERIRTYKKRLWFRPHLFVLDCFSVGGLFSFAPQRELPLTGIWFHHSSPSLSLCPASCLNQSLIRSACNSACTMLSNRRPRSGKCFQTSQTRSGRAVHSSVPHCLRQKSCKCRMLSLAKPNSLLMQACLF